MRIGLCGGQQMWGCSILVSGGWLVDVSASGNGNPPCRVENANIDAMGCGNAPCHVENAKSMWEGGFPHPTASKMRTSMWLGWENHPRKCESEVPLHNRIEKCENRRLRQKCEIGKVGFPTKGVRKFKNCTGYVDFFKPDGYTPSPNHPKGDEWFQKRKFSAQ